jgi:hypothetical protein
VLQVREEVRSQESGDSPATGGAGLNVDVTQNYWFRYELEGGQFCPQPAF